MGKSERERERERERMGVGCLHYCLAKCIIWKGKKVGERVLLYVCMGRCTRDFVGHWIGERA